jgi:hypothetical protein
LPALIYVIRGVNHFVADGEATLGGSGVPEVRVLKSLGFSRQCFVARSRRNNSAAERNHFERLAQMSGNRASLSN